MGGVRGPNSAQSRRLKLLRSMVWFLNYRAVANLLRGARGRPSIDLVIRSSRWRAGLNYAGDDCVSFS